MTQETIICSNCNGRGEVGGFLSPDSGYQTDLCPACNDGAVMQIWRECGLSEDFLGNGGTNHKLVAFARRIGDVAYKQGFDDGLSEKSLIGRFDF